MPLRSTLVVLGLFLSYSGLADRVAHCQQWPRFLGVNFDGALVDASKQIDWNSKPSLLWSIEVADGYGIGTVADGRYLHFDATARSDAAALGVFGQQERLRSFELASGKPQWSQSESIQYRDMFGYEDGPRSSPTIDGDLVFTLGVTGKLNCCDLKSGARKWSVDTNRAYGVVQNFFGVGSSPLVLGNRVIVMVGGSPSEDQQIPPMRLDRVSPNGTAVVAFDRESGKELWKCGDDLASYSSPRTMEVGGETLVLVFARGGLLALDPTNGEVRWRFDHRAAILESVNAMMPVVDKNRVLISECYEVGSALLEVSGKSARVVWQDPPRDRRRQSMRCHWATPILIDGFLYGCSGRNAPDSDLRCIEWETGQVQWSDPRRIRSSVTRVGDHLILLEERGLVQVVKPNPKRLDVVAEWDLAVADGPRPAIDYPCWAAPIVVGTKLLLRGTSRVLCLDLAGN